MMKMKKSRALLSIIAVVAVLGGAFGIYEYQRGHEDMADLDADFSLATAKILAEFQADNAAANQKYLGKVVQLSGTVAEVKALESGGTNVVLKEGANCAFLGAVTLQEGQAISIRGECTGFMEEEMMDLLEVNLTRCALID